MDYTNITSCRLCRSPNIGHIIYFGEMPLANSYPRTAEEKEELYPLTLMRCENCGHIQLRETISPEKLFSNYLYASSDSPALVAHFKGYASEILSKVRAYDYTQILEIASNDGILLKEFEALGLTQLVGVEPATNIAEISRKNTGATIYNDFFNESFAKVLQQKHGCFDVICANNVFAHVAGLDSLTQGVAYLLSSDGMFVFENAYLLDTVRKLYFDQIYHEHLQYYGITPLVSYFKKFGLEIFDVGYVNTQGGSFRIYVKKNSNKLLSVTDRVQHALDEEKLYGLYNPPTYERFWAEISNLQKKLSALFERIVSTGKTICCYGCPAKFALFSKIFGLTKDNIKYVVDDSPLKQGRFSPGKRIPIVNNEYFYMHPTDYCLISVWNMKDGIISKNKGYKGIWIVPMPELQVI